jgi:branched-chain amino acid transport system ATP-binding protein
MLETRGLSRSFGGIRAVTNLSFIVQRGEVLGLIGPNGAGKTTVVNLISGMTRPSAGQVILNGQSVTGYSPQKLAGMGLARTFQSTTVFGEQTALENVRRGGFQVAHVGWLKEFFGTHEVRQREAAADERARELLKELALGDVADRLAGGLPYGKQKALGIAIALAAQPQIVLLDEPVAGLSSEEASHVRDMLIKIRNAGITVMVIDHNMRFIAGLCDRVVVIHHGQELADGRPDVVLADPKVAEAYLGASYARQFQGR